MENLLGGIRVRVLRGINLVAKDTRTSDPYVVLTIGDQVDIFPPTISTKIPYGMNYFTLYNFII